MFIGLYCCLLVRVQPLSLAWADLHHTNSLWALFQGPIVEFRFGYPIFYLRTSKFSLQQPFRPILLKWVSRGRIPSWGYPHWRSGSLLRLNSIRQPSMVDWPFFLSFYWLSIGVISLYLLLPSYLYCSIASSFISVSISCFLADSKHISFCCCYITHVCYNFLITVSFVMGVWSRF